MSPRNGGQAYYDSLAKLYAAWGLDFIKADDMFGFGPDGDHSSEIGALSKALRSSGRPIVLSLSPGTRDAAKVDFIGKNAEMWRISGDFWDRWVDLKRQFPNFAKWNPYVKPGNWPDGDMLPLRPHRHPRRTRRPAHVAPDSRRAAHPDDPVVHRALSADVRRQPARQRRIHAQPDHQ